MLMGKQEAKSIPLKYAETSKYLTSKGGGVFLHFLNSFQVSYNITYLNITYLKITLRLQCLLMLHLQPLLQASGTVNIVASNLSQK